MKKENESMEIVNPNAAGIDVGSRSHFIAIGQKKEDVREFGVYSEDLHAVADYLKLNKIRTVAMESTGSYWQNLFSVLQDAGFEVLLCNGKFTKNIKGKKTDVQDCQWIQKLHSLGLLSGSFLPDPVTEQLRTYCRHKCNYVDQSADVERRMQRYLRLMNFRLDVAVRSITGLTGISIIEAICNGTEDPKELAKLRHGNCKRSQQEIEKALQGNIRSDFLFALQQEYELYKVLQNKIEQCDQKISEFLSNQIPEDRKSLATTDKKHKRGHKNSNKLIDLNQISYQYFGGVDLMQVEGLSHNTVMSILSEIGPDGFGKFKTGKAFSSWLKLCPNNKISGGKVLSRKIPKGSNRVKIALRSAANVIGNMKDTQLSRFFHKMAYKYGRQAAISATARKLAVIIWNMVTKRISYSPPSNHEYLDQKRKRKVVELNKLVNKYGIKQDEILFATS